MTVEQATKGPLPRICTTTYYNDTLVAYEPPLAGEDEDAINALLGCSGILSTSCSIVGTNAVICNCYHENQTRCRVTLIDFSNKGLGGRIPEKIGNLTYLETLSLTGNKLSGSIPDSFGKLTNLVELFLCGNSLGGPIPTFFHEKMSLKKLYLCNNFFNQTIPPELGSLRSLKILHLGYNLLSGKIPDLGNTNLTGLYLVDNQLTDEVSQLGNLLNLEELWLENNEFIGVLPPSFKSLTKLRYFNVRGNNFNGKIPDFIDQWQNLHVMNMMGNIFSAPLPDQISNLKNLRELYISDLDGESSPFPDLSGMNNLSLLTLRNCSIVGRIPHEISKLPQLQYLDLSFNKLFGGIPPALGSSTLRHIFLRRNKLNETNEFNEAIPSAWLNTNLTYVFLRRNKLNETNEFNETIPSAWLNTNLTYVDVSENLFRNVTINSANQNLNLFECCSNGNDEVANWGQDDLHCSKENDHLYINCGGNSVSINGRDYEADENKPGGSTFFKSESSNWAYSSMGTFLWSSHNIYQINDTFQIHVEDAQLYSTARVSPISLKYYGFCLKAGMYNVKLHFAEISSRKSKSVHGNAKRIFNVEIQGKDVLKDFSIERAAEGINKPIIVEHKTFVNSSRLEIHLYWYGKGSVLYPSSYYGPLISAISVTTEPDQSVFPSRVIAGISGFVLFLLILVIGFIWRYEDKLRQEERELVELYPGGLYNYQKIKAATKNFASENWLGEGGFGTVYKGILSNGTLIAVKKLSATKEGMYEFLEKSRIIAGMEHQNLATLMGCCAGKNQLLLIYEYNGSNTLEDVLFGYDEVRARLDWPTRYKICLGLAEGLAFLHEGFKRGIIHGDIKPANIILDDDLNPKIYDFGFARLYDKQRSEGTVLYTAPEVGDRPLEASADVYSFGVVTLILVSGKKIKRVVAGGYTEYLVEEALEKHRKGTLMELVDQNLNYDSEEAELILTLAIECIDISPPFRPTMSTVVKILKKECPMESISVNKKVYWERFASMCFV